MIDHILTEWLALREHAACSPIIAILEGLQAADLARFVQVCQSSLLTVTDTWVHVLARRGLRADAWREENKLSIVSGSSIESSDDEKMQDNESEKQWSMAWHLFQWAKLEKSERCDIELAWGTPAPASLLHLVLQPKARLSLRALACVEVALAEVVSSLSFHSAGRQDRATAYDCALLMQHADDQALHRLALDALPAKLLAPPQRAEESQRHVEEAITPYIVLCRQLVRAADDEAVSAMLGALIDVCLAPGTAHASSSWHMAREVPVAARRLAAFAAAAAMTGKPAHADLAAPGRGRVLAAGSELLAGLLPSHWGRGTAASEDPVLRRAASEALQIAEIEQGGWAAGGTHAPDVALRVASRKLRAKLGLRMGG
eukprot:TRINITY_DN26067_c0_g1_i2.p1 TRINITY_DN26067_c0_g1~~TRINITY_DN26067_c0_g1_i2.p1  ORF type:complete len:381 (+),score=47.81 TRINITY_DN26067_c0_g1_i2:26-1144(+)